MPKKYQTCEKCSHFKITLIRYEPYPTWEIGCELKLLNNPTELQCYWDEMKLKESKI
jgi:hypothetical protein